MKLYKVQLDSILRWSFYHSHLTGMAFGGSQFLLFACNALLLWYAAMIVKRDQRKVSRVLKEYMIFSFASFALVEPFELAPNIFQLHPLLLHISFVVDMWPTRLFLCIVSIIEVLLVG